MWGYHIRAELVREFQFPSFFDVFLSYPAPVTTTAETHLCVAPSARRAFTPSSWSLVRSCARTPRDDVVSRKMPPASRSCERVSKRLQLIIERCASAAWSLGVGMDEADEEEVQRLRGPCCGWLF